jgi:regulatory protein
MIPMPVITQISEQRRRENRRNVYLDGAFAFGCNLNVIARFRLREGMTLTPDEVQKIQLGEVKQECFDKAMTYIGARLHSRAELVKKLARREYGPAVIDAVMEDLVRMGYVNDEQFALSKVQSIAKHKHHGKRRAAIELTKAGVKGEAAKKALDEVYDAHDSVSVARTLAEKKAPSLRKLEPMVAKRRLIGMLQRRGFDYESIKPVVEEVLGRDPEE